jgi:hypothetical protein
MPFFDYRCKICGRTKSIFRKIVEHDVPPGPEDAPVLSPEEPQHLCEWEKLLGPTPTTFRHNDRTAHKS